VQRSSRELATLPYAGAVRGRVRQDRRLTITLLTVTTAFLILLLWQCFAQCFHKLHNDDKDQMMRNLAISFYAFGKLGVVVNSSIHCLLYFLSGSLYRRELLRILCLWKEGARGGGKVWLRRFAAPVNSLPGTSSGSQSTTTTTTATTLACRTLLGLTPTF
jgi:hypothetical protein